MLVQQRPNRRLIVLLLLLPAALAAYAGNSRNAKKADKIQPEARKLLDDVAKMYAGLKSLRLESETAFVMEMDGMPGKDLPGLTVVVKTSIQRPEKVRREGGMGAMGQSQKPSLAVSNGETLWIFRGESNEYTVARPNLATKATVPDPMLALQSAFAPSAHDVDWSFLTRGLTSAVLSRAGETIGGVACRTVKCSLPMVSLISGEEIPPGSSSMYIDLSVSIDEDLVIRKIDLDMTKMMKEMQKSAESKNVPRINRMVYSTTYTKVELNPVLPDDLFVFSPPEGAKLVKEFSSGADREEVSLEGKPAPDFTLPSSDGKSLNLKQLRGKPVLLNFYGEF